MVSLLPLIGAIGITGGALFGLPGIIFLPIATGFVVGMARQPFLILVAVMLLATITGHARVTLQPRPELDQSILAAREIEGTVRSVPRIGPSGQRATIEVSRIQESGSGNWTDADGQVLVFFRDTVTESIRKGDRVRIGAYVQNVDGMEHDFGRFVQSEGGAGAAWPYVTSIIDRGEDRVNVVVRLRESITRRITSALSGDKGGLLAGFVTGDDSGLSDAMRLAFERTNTSHITAVSGGNVGILLAMWGFLVPAGRFRRHMLVQLAIVLSIWTYVALVGFGAASLRAALFATLLIPAARMGRRADPMTALMVASAILLLVEPSLADSVGYWLSLAASAAMITVISPGAHSTSGLIRRLPMGLVAAQFATLPITFWAFGQWSPASFIANLVIGPLVAAMMPIAFVMAVLVYVPVIGGAFAWIPGLGASVILACVESLSSDFSMLQAGPANTAGMVLLAIFCAMVIAAVSVDVHRWVLRIEFAHLHCGERVPAVLVGAVAGGALGIICIALLQAANAG